MDEQKENKPKKLDKEAKKILKEELFEPDPMVEVPVPKGNWIEEQADGEQQKKEWKQRESAKPLIDLDKGIVKNVDFTQKESLPEGKVAYHETMWKKGLKEMPPDAIKLNHPVQAYSMRMGEIEPLEDMMWRLLEKIGFLPAYPQHTTSQVYFELGKIYREFMTKLQEFVENKGK